MDEKEYFPFSNINEVSFEVRENPNVDTILRINYGMINHNNFFRNIRLNNNTRAHIRKIDMLKRNYKNAIQRKLKCHEITDSLLFQIYQQCVQYNFIRPFQEDEKNKQISFVDLTVNRKEQILLAFTQIIQVKPNIVNEIKQQNGLFHF